MSARVCILGGTGFVGGALAARLAAQGTRVILPTRHRERARHLLVLPTAEVVECDIHDDAVLAGVLEDCDAAVNLIGILHETRTASFARVHGQLPARVARLCREQGVIRLLHMSALGAASASRSAYQRSKAEGEAAVLSTPGLDVTVFRPSVIFGRGDRFLSLFARLSHLAPILPLADANALFQPVWVEDVARAFACSLDTPDTSGQAYNLCGPRAYTLRELVGHAARMSGARTRIVPLGPRLSHALAWLMEHMPGPTLMTRDNHAAMQTPNVCAGGFPDVFGFTPTALESITPQYLARHAGGPFGAQRQRAGR